VSLPLELAGCTLTYGAFRLGPVDLTAPASSRLLLQGRNGSGKTTLLRLAAGLELPASGTARVEGVPAHDRHAVPLIGFVPDHRDDLPAELSATEIWGFAARARAHLLAEGAVGRRRFVTSAEALAERLGFTDWRRPARQLSHGNYRKLQIATWLGQDPTVVLLDEPHNGLDRHGSTVLTSLMSEWSRSGAAVLMASHAPLDALHVDRVIDVVDGRLQDGPR
jgi:ABC-type multidrug transport system ATPase subunit